MPTSNETWAGMIALDMRVTVHCAPCERSVEVDLTKLPPDGNAIGVKFRCSTCGEYGRATMSPASNLNRRPQLSANFYGDMPRGPRPAILVKGRRRRR